MSKRSWAAHVGGVIVVLLTLVYIARPSPHIPPYDANLVRLVETERQGYCAGLTLWRAQDANADMTAACRAERRDLSGEVNMVAAERAFCEAIVDSGWEGAVGDCLGIMAANQYWPTYDGFITLDWNRARPYPKSGISSNTQPQQQDDSRTGGRTGAPSRGW